MSKLSDFGCYMEELIKDSSDYDIYIIEEMKDQGCG